MMGEPMASNAAAETRCPVCNSAVVSWRQKQTADETFSILMCCACRYAFVSPRPSLSQLMDFYAKQGHGERAGSPVPLDLEFVHEAERRYPNSSLDAKRIVKTIDRLTPDCSPARKRFLDVGCGCGFFSLEAQTLGFAVTSLELAETERRLTAQMTGHRPLNFSFEDFEANAGSFDAILMSQILEHAHDTRRWIEKAHRLLKQKGVLAVALPNFDSFVRCLLQEKDPYISPPAHLNFFTSQSLLKLLDDVGFSVRKTAWVSRLPRSAFEKRLSFLGRPGIGLAHALSRLLMKGADWLGFGMMINMYAVKEGATEHHV